ncbi:MAG TPA: response regulator transcription factor [Flavisolibacter sp.]|nr:response regulator transcription factor [Flavisolibacter sp.]
MPVKNILLVDDHLVVRTGLKVILHDYYTKLQIFEADNGEGALRVLKKESVDLVILDLQLPNTDTISLVELISIKYPNTYILVFSMLPETIYARRVLKAGASGFLPKDTSQEEIKRAFDFGFANKKYISPTLSEVLVKEVAGNGPVSPFANLSHREFEIVSLLLGGNSLAKISELLHIKPSTTGTYKTRIFEKLQITSLFELKELADLYRFIPLSGNL